MTANIFIVPHIIQLLVEYSKIPLSGVNALARRRREELEAQLDQIDSKVNKLKLTYRAYIKKY